MTSPKKKNVEKIILDLAKKYYPDDNLDWSERHRALALIGELMNKLEIII